MTENFDATPAYRGYRLQALYALHQILTSISGDNRVFRPEGQEDLAILDSDGKLVEVFQVKSYSDDLSLSSLEPEKANSFLYRVFKQINGGSQAKFHLVSFGNIGPELSQALKGAIDKLKIVSKKIGEKGHITDNEAIEVLKRINLIQVNETYLTAEVNSLLEASLPGIDPKTSFELLQYWLTICSEEKRKITRTELIEKINKIGRYIAESSAHHQEWFTSIVPIEDRDVSGEQRDSLAEQFYQGVSARYEHILANLDISRATRMQEISECFKNNQVVIIHGSSGQGKSTLAFRYVHEFFPEAWRFRVRILENRVHALTVATALEGHAKALGITLIVYLDVSPHDSGWPELVKQLATHENIRVLVAIREEDFKRSSVSGADFKFSTVELTFNHEEARAIYHQLTEYRRSHSFLDFDDAWSKFGSTGPLMEFVYLVTQGASLRDRLRGQIKRLMDEVRTGDLKPEELQLLRLTSVASAFEARLKVKPLAKQLGLNEPKRTFELLEKEYLIRVTEEGTLVQGLHPLRSTILTELLIDDTFNPWVELAALCLPFIHDDDIEAFLLYSFLRRRSDSSAIISALHAYRPEQWIAMVGIIRALLWYGVSNYVEENRKLISEAHSEFGTAAWWMAFDFDITDVLPGAAGSLQNILDEILADRPREKINNIRNRQTDRKAAFSEVTKWLSNITPDFDPPRREIDWSAMAESLFWMTRLGKVEIAENCLNEPDFNRAFNQLSIEELSELVLALSWKATEKINLILNKYRPMIIERFRTETQTLFLEDDGSKIKLHFLFDFNRASQDDLNKKKGLHDPFGDEAMDRIRILHNILPDREQYASQGYGHKLWPGFLSHDSTEKCISTTHLPPRWPIWVNRAFQGLAEYIFRPVDWAEYEESVLKLRKKVVEVLVHICKSVETHFRKRKKSNLSLEYAVDLSIGPLLPKCAVDQWGVITESTDFNKTQKQGESIILRNIALQRFNPFLKSFGNYTSSLFNFFHQARDIFQISHIAGKNDRSNVAAALGINSNIPGLSIFNLLNSMKELLIMQAEFKRLLGSLVPVGSMDSLNHDEVALFKKLWTMWYVFANSPGEIMLNPIVECSNRSISVLKDAKGRLNREFGEISRDGSSIVIISESLEWETDQALWIKINGSSAIDVYSVFGEALVAAKSALGESGKTEYRRWVIESTWPYLVAILTVDGKCLQETAFKIPVPVLCNTNGELPWFNLAPRPIPQDALVRLGVQSWEPDRFTIANEFFQSIAELSLLIAHIRDINNMPDLDPSGLNQLQKYIGELEPKMSQLFQRSLDSVVSIASLISQYPTDQHLIQVATILAPLKDSLLPVSDFGDSATLTMEMLIDWANRLENVRPSLHLIYLHLMSFSLKGETVN